LNKEQVEAAKKKEKVKPENAIAWIKSAVVGNITKRELDDERMTETNSLDMMQNSSIVYHTESILEMQVMCLVSLYFVNEWWKAKKGYGNLATDDTAYIILLVLLVEHIFSYFFGIFRNREIDQHGKPNSYGIEYAPKEFCLRVFEIILDLAIFVWITLYLVGISQELMHNIPLIHYWVIIDMVIMFFTLPYSYFSKLMMRTGEITKNIFTLYQVQKRKLKGRRETFEKQDQNWKSFFEVEEKKLEEQNEEPKEKVKRMGSMMLKAG